MNIILLATAFAAMVTTVPFDRSQTLMPDEARVREIAEMLPEKPEFRGARPQDEAVWRRLAAMGWGKNEIAKAEKIIQSPVPECPDELYLLFTKTGNRDKYQKPYFDRQAYLQTLAFAEKMEGKGRFLPKMAEYIESFLTLRSWTMPAHDSALKNFNGERFNVELGSGHLVQVLTVALMLHRDKLPPETVKKILAEIDRRIFACYRPFRDNPKLQDKYGSWWYYGESNWNAVCNCCVIESALALIDDRMERARYIESAERTVPYFLSGLLDDGYCTEGMGYWNYGFGYYLRLVWAVRQATDGKIDLAAHPKARKSMEYACGFQLVSGVSPDFADGDGNPDTGALKLGGAVWPDLVSAKVSSDTTINSGWGVFHYLTFDGIEQVAKATKYATLPPNTFYPCAQVLFSRADAADKRPFSVAVKGGNNAELHNHNDLGSYSVYLGSVPISGDPGSETYTARTFSKDRYVSKVLNSFGHPVPVVNGKLQRVGAKAQAKVLETELAGSTDLIALDLTTAYEEPLLKSLVRRLTHDRVTRTVKVEDTVRFAEGSSTTFEVPFVTHREVLAGGENAWYLRDEKSGELIKVAVASEGGAPEIVRETIPNPGYPTIYRVGVRLTGCKGAAKIAFTFSTVAPGALVKGATEIVVDAQAPKATRIAADELKTLLGGIFGEAVPVVTKPTDGKRAIVLGTNALSRAAGLAPEKLPRDAFRLLAKDGRVYIAGCDATYADPEAHNYLGDECLWQPQFERGTLFGVYEFLERQAGARFYFPGELGTILPRRDVIEVGGLDVTSAPDFTVRRWGYADGPVPEEVLAGTDITTFKRTFFYRLRGETEYKPCCHGQNKLFLSQRFGKAHPEYLRLDANGHRSELAPEWSDRPPINVGHLCLSSGVWDEIYKDAKSYFSGEDASVRGVHAPDGQEGYVWGRNASEGKFMDVMPQDCYSRCFCEACKRAYGDKKDTNYATELIWSKTAEIARRLKADGLTGRLAMMAYHPYGRVPDFDLPDNIDVMVACSGPWTFRSKGVLQPQVDKISAWAKKLGHKVWIWNYVDKVQCVGTAIPDAPSVSPRVMGQFYQLVKDQIFGAFAESESDRWLYHYLNYYVFAKVAWDNDVDVNALLDEHYRLMFGPAAAEMQAFFEQLEDCWVDGIAGLSEDTPLGPRRVTPGPVQLWTKIYGPDTMAKLDGLLTAAAAKAPAGSLEARRVALFRTHYFEPLRKWPKQFFAETNLKAEQERRAARTVKSILSNGDFSTLDGWKGELPEWGTVSLSTKEFVSPPSSLLLEGTNMPKKEGEWLHFFATQFPEAMKTPLKPATRYRVSFYVKCDGARPISHGGGLYFQWWDADWNWVPRKGMPVSGTTEWMHLAYEFKTPEKFSDRKDHFVQFMLTGAVGKIYVDDVILEEL